MIQRQAVQPRCHSVRKHMFKLHVSSAALLVELRTDYFLSVKLFTASLVHCASASAVLNFDPWLFKLLIY